LWLGFLYVLPEESSPAVCFGFVLSRSFSALSIASFKMAKDTGLARTFSDMSAKISVKISSTIYILVSIILLLWYNIFMGLAVFFSVLVSFIYYRLSFL
jgi:adenosylcobinamide-GDP ribazoletransferase